MPTHRTIASDDIAHCVARMRKARPHVHCITNTVAQAFTANVLLAAGMTPSMTVAPDEMQGFVGRADALLVNLGTMNEARRDAIAVAAETAAAAGKPWLLDPVFAQASEPRLALARQCLERNPTALRLNLGEARALFGETFTSDDLPKIATRHAIALTGAEDHVATTTGRATVRNGSPFMDRVTAMGCALSAVMAGFLAVEEDATLALSAALTFYGLAGSTAEAVSAGPGTFVPAFIDALANLTADDIAAGARIA